MRRVPGLRSGTLSLFCLFAWLVLPAYASRELALDLFDEENWNACRTECDRQLLLDPDDPELRRVQAIAEAHSENGSRPDRVHWSMQPLRWILLLYQSQIRPALGRRCSLHPGCSSFMMESIRRHGPLGVAMYTDRAVREPSVVQEKKKIVYVNGRRAYSDPVDDHDWWMRNRSERRRQRDRRRWVLPLTRAGATPKGTKNEP